MAVRPCGMVLSLGVAPPLLDQGKLCEGRRGLRPSDSEPAADETLGPDADVPPGVPAPVRSGMRASVRAGLESKMDGHDDTLLPRADAPLPLRRPLFGNGGVPEHGVNKAAEEERHRPAHSELSRPRQDRPARNGSVEHPARGSPLGASKTGRPTRLAGLDSGVDAAATKSPTGRSPKVERRTTMSAEREAAELRSALEDVEARFQEEKILSTVETQCAYELMDQIKVESDLRHGKLAAALASAKSEVMFLKASLFDRESELRRAHDATKKLQDDARTNSTADELKAQLQGARQENGQLKLELRQYESEKVPEESDADAAAEAAKKGATEAELRRLRVQAEQWRKAAETAMALLTVGKGGNGKILDRGESLDGGKYAGLYDELDDDAAAARKNGNVLRRISGMWKK
ncbi:hypothetical protein TRIUR3_32433 [Triticum urartu]|uniref:Interactor of constitutive active ROPs 2, chloroplastic n=1 Tax=Triticum urartu TaxID=4572 RepID=M7ZKL7_TRIUA|nr:hypothetical protein TRIUR3_32433 [Triticum urartu]